MANTIDETNENVHLECNEDMLMYAYQCIRENKKLSEPGLLKYFAMPPPYTNEKVMIYFGQVNKDMRHALIVPKTEMSFTLLNRCATVQNSADARTHCELQASTDTKSAALDDNYIEIPEINLPVDKWITNILDLLFTVVEESESVAEVFHAALIEYWVAANASKFVGNLDELVSSCDGLVANLLKRGFELWECHYQDPRANDCAFVMDIARSVDRYFGDTKIVDGIMKCRRAMCTKI